MTARAVRRIFLLGAPGSGKTAVGEALSRGLNVEFVSPQSRSEDFVRDPELAGQLLSEYTCEVLQPLNQRDGLLVVELPPSALLDPQARALLCAARQHGDVAVWLDAPAQILARRAGLSAPQMGFLGTPRAWFRTLYCKLSESYQDMFDLRLDTADADPLGLAQEVARTCGLN